MTADDQGAQRFTIQIVHDGDVLETWRTDHTEFRRGDHVSLRDDEYADMVISLRVWTGPTALALWVERGESGATS